MPGVVEHASPNASVYWLPSLQTVVASEPISGRLIVRTLASAIAGAENGPTELRVVDRKPVRETTAHGTFACALEYDEKRVADVSVHPDRVRVEFRAAPDVAAAVGGRAGLRVRPKATRPPRTLVFVESPAQVWPALDVVEAVCDAVARAD